MAEQEKSQFGMIGMGVMGLNLALNILDRGTSYDLRMRYVQATGPGAS